MTTEPLRVTYREERDILLVDDVKYAGGVFRSMAFFTPGSLFEFVENDEGTIEVRDHGAVEEFVARIRTKVLEDVENTLKEKFGLTLDDDPFRIGDQGGIEPVWELKGNQP